MPSVCAGAQFGRCSCYWATFQADKLTTRQAECGLLRMMAPAWWYVKIKRARDVQREH
ncbi:replication endonuclease, partial [Cronobacter sakazakii]|uniref:replication endonuclease n=1 Tax=Cronobacter sakazakii TaxID=28141 RepID=UPI001F1EF719|nr:replication endonuclease [Cronobacter sakazakii]